MLTVTELTRELRDLIEGHFPEVWVKGEVSNLRVQSSGHQYFTLKDAGAQLSCVLFRGRASFLSAPLRDGQSIEVCGQISVYEARGQYQMIARVVRATGEGALQAEFERLKRKLAEEGLFTQENKIPLPSNPATVVLVTSPTGAAIRDMLQVIGRRAPWTRVLVAPVLVQGAGAAESIAKAIRWVNRASGENGFPKVDVIIVGRGGGSLEDLWSFNEEVTVRAVAESRLPIVSAVGHEIDVTLCDFAADLRAPTPSAAAELIVQDQKEILRRLDSLDQILEQRIQRLFQSWNRELDLISRTISIHTLERRVLEAEQKWDEMSWELQEIMKQRLGSLQDKLAWNETFWESKRPDRVLTDWLQRCSDLEGRLAYVLKHRLESNADRLQRHADLLRSLGPEETLARGYSITTNEEGKVIRSIEEVSPGMRLKTRVRDGDFTTEVQLTPS